MAVILFITGAVGFLASFCLLQLGLSQMVYRYPLAVLLAYGAFLFLLWRWFGRQSRRQSRRDLDPGSPDFNLFSSGSAKPELSGEGNFGGGGAGRSWVSSSDPVPQLSETPVTPSGSSGTFFEHFDFGIDLDEGAFLLIPFLLTLTVAFAALYAIYLAPAFIFELLIDAALAGTLYARLRRSEPHDWFRSAVRWTWGPAVLIALVFAVSGYALQYFAPHAVSIGQVWAARP
jgi:hypothetical protein